MSADNANDYVLRFPFELVGSHEISGVEESVSRPFKSLAMRLEGNGQFCVLTVTGFESSAAARDFITPIWAGLTWVLLNRGIVFRAELEPRSVVFFDDPVEAARNISKGLSRQLDQRLDGMGDGHGPCVYASDKHLRFLTSLPVTARIGNPVEQFLDYFEEGIGAKNSEAIISDTRLRTAIDLYCAHFTETSRHAKLITLVMAIESLTNKSDKQAVALELIAKWQSEIKDAMDVLDPDCEDHFSLKCLERELLFRRETSIRSRVKDLVLQTFSECSAREAHELANKAVRIYDMRGSLVHDGTLPEKQLAVATKDAQHLVARILRAKFEITVVRPKR